MYRVTYDVTARRTMTGPLGPVVGGERRQTSIITTEGGSPATCRTLARRRAQDVYGPAWTVRVHERASLELPA